MFRSILRNTTIQQDKITLDLYTTPVENYWYKTPPTHFGPSQTPDQSITYSAATLNIYLTEYSAAWLNIIHRA